MCGIGGVVHFDPSRTVRPEVLEAMAACIRHRGPDGSGFFVDRNVGLAHRRLSIIDLTTGDQPMVDGEGGLVIVFNGEIYNYVELREELRTRGHRFRTESDTEVLLRGYQEWGTDVHGRLNGMWAFALWDARRRELVLSRDRVGEKPLHYALWDNSLLFGSEIKSLLAAGLPRELDPEVLETFLGLGYVPAPGSLVKRVRKLRPGHFLTIRAGSVREETYWDLPAVPERALRSDSDGVEREFHALLKDSVRLRMRSDVPVGAFLSGGLDSASVVAAVVESENPRIDTFTIGFGEDGFDERPLARQLANHFGTNHHEILVTPESFDESLSLVLRHCDEPFGDSSALATAEVARFASRKVKVVVTGDGGDEVLSGYTGYQSEKFATALGSCPRWFREAATRVATVAGSAVGIARPRVGAWVKTQANTALVPFEERLLTKALWADRATLTALLAPVGGAVQPLAERLRELMAGCRHVDGFYRLMYFNYKVSLPDDMLTKVDRMTMAFSVEARTPFLDHRLVELMAGVHKNVKMRGLERKSVLRRTIGRTLPPAILRARKRGFVVPLREWFRTDALRDRYDELSRRNPLGLAPDALARIFAENKSGVKDHGNLIWMLFLLDGWFGMAGAKCGRS